MKCDKLLPNNLDGSISKRECLLDLNHKSLHLVQLDDGQYLTWYPLDECFCGKMPCECFTYRFITEAEAQRLLVS